MRKILFAALLMCFSTSIAHAENVRLKAFGSPIAATSNEVGIWKNAAAAAKAPNSLAAPAARKMYKQIACVIKPRSKAKVTKRGPNVSQVTVKKGLLGRCSGFISNKFISK